MSLEENMPRKRKGKTAVKTALATAVDYLARQAHSEK